MVQKKYRGAIHLVIFLALLAYLIVSQNSRSIPLFDSEKFAKKMADGPPRWVTSQINEDLLPFSKYGISEESIENAFIDHQYQDENLALFKIEKQQLTTRVRENLAKTHHYKEVKKALETLLKNSSVPNVTFLVSLHTPSHVNSKSYPVPILVFAKRKGRSGPVLMPDSDALAGHLELRKLVKNGIERYPWKKKVESGFWRGSAKAHEINSENWKLLPRSKIVMLSSYFPRAINAKFYSISSSPQNMRDEVEDKNLIGPFVNVGEQFEYKYLLDIDGACCTNKRCFGQLYSNCVTFKQQSKSIQWYYGPLQPYIHYVPLKKDLSDVLEKIGWAMSHDPQAKQIARNGTRFVEENLSYEDQLLYIHTLLESYAALQVNSNN